MLSLRDRRETIWNGNKNVVDARGHASCGVLMGFLFVVLVVVG